MREVFLGKIPKNFKPPAREDFLWAKRPAFAKATVGKEGGIMERRGQNSQAKETKPTLRLSVNPNNTVTVVPRNGTELRAAMALGFNYTTPGKS